MISALMYATAQIEHIQNVCLTEADQMQHACTTEVGQTVVWLCLRIQSLMASVFWISFLFPGQVYTVVRQWLHALKQNIKHC